MKTILITGVSSGLGRAMAYEALHRGHRVVGTLRDEGQRLEFESHAPGRSVGRLLDLTDTDAIPALVQSVEGPIDVLINNAGYGLQGVIEELALNDLRRQFEVNLFAPMALIQAVLPAMRSRRAGHIVNMSSMGGVLAFPGLGAYHGTKFALLGMNDALLQEVRPLGVRVTAVLPGVFRSDWNGRSQFHAARRIADYDAVLNQKADFKWGDPAALGRVVLDAIEMDEPPEHLIVGPTAIKGIRSRLAHLNREIDRWEQLSEAGGEG
jgi:NAD(P)-dependent dehydrogenase (short-subunit alcohol dehydrogenase family)